MADKVRIHGLDEVRKRLRALPRDMAKKEVARSLNRAARLVRDTAKTFAPTGSDSYTRSLRGKTWNHKAGTLRDSIVSRKEKKKFLRNAARRRVGVLSSSRDPNVGAWYWKFVEFGTSKMPARPFLSRGFEASKRRAAAMIKEDLLKGMQRSRRRVSR